MVIGEGEGDWCGHEDQGSERVRISTLYTPICWPSPQLRLPASPTSPTWTRPWPSASARTARGGRTCPPPRRRSARWGT